MESGTGDPVWHLESPDAQVAVIAALELEAAPLRRAFGAAGAAIRVSGPGAAAAARAAARALDDGADALVSWGLAGGLEPGAKTGSIVLPERLLSADGEFTADRQWRLRFNDAAAHLGQPLGGPLFSADHVLTTAAEKAALRQRTGAVAVDMESSAVAAVAAAAGARFIAVRVIADGPEDALPERVEELVTPAGRTRLAGLLPLLLAPRQLGRLIRLGRQSRQARLVLRRLAASLAGPAR